MATAREQAMTHGSPALATLIVALGGALAGRALLGRAVLARVLRRDEMRAAAERTPDEG